MPVKFIALVEVKHPSCSYQNKDLTRISGANIKNSLKHTKKVPETTSHVLFSSLCEEKFPKFVSKNDNKDTACYYFSFLLLLFLVSTHLF